MRVEGTIHLAGGERYRLEMATETAPVARKAIKLMHSLYGLKTELTVRRSVLHKTNNYLITVPSQPALQVALADLGILDEVGGFTYGVPARLVRKDCCAVSYLRGAFLGGGFVADPHGDFHFELTAETEQHARDLVGLMARFGIEARVTRRRGLFAVYLKGAEPIVTFLALVGAHRALLRTEDVRIIKSMRNDVNRLVNAETANLQKSADAAISQVEDICTGSRGCPRRCRSSRNSGSITLTSRSASSGSTRLRRCPSRRSTTAYAGSNLWRRSSGPKRRSRARLTSAAAGKVRSAADNV
jgi:DNA-binding protein WhiA